MHAATALLRDLTDVLGSHSILSDEREKAAYETDWRKIVAHPAALVVLPRNVAEVQAVVRICTAHGTAMVPQGGNTGLVAGAVPTAGRREVIVNLKKMNKILSIDLTDNTMIVEAGVVLDAVRRRASLDDRLFPLSLAAGGSCQIGGNIATNAGGVHVLSYGSMRNLVLGLQVVTAGGALWDGLRTLRKDNTGIDLKQLFIGSEGILGIITAAAVRIVPNPRATLTVLAAVRDAAAAVAVFDAFQNRHGQELTSFEYFEELGLSLVLSHLPSSRPPFESRHPAYVLVEMSALEQGRDLASGAETLLVGAAESHAVLDALVASSEAQRQAFWALRENQSEAERIAGGAIKHDVTVPITAIAPTINKIRAALATASPHARLNIFGHIGDGNLHVNVLPPPGTRLADFIAANGRLSDLLYDIVMAAGGTFSAEHGIGQLRKTVLAQRRTALELDLMRAVKRALDPAMLFNPGKVFDA